MGGRSWEQVSLCAKFLPKAQPRRRMRGLFLACPAVGSREAPLGAPQGRARSSGKELGLCSVSGVPGGLGQTETGSLREGVNTQQVMRHDKR